MDRNMPVPIKLMNADLIHDGSSSNWLGPEQAEFATEQVLSDEVEVSEEVEESEGGTGETSATSKGTNTQGMSGQEGMAIRRRISQLERANDELEMKIQELKMAREDAATPRASTPLPAPFYCFVQEPAYVHTMPRSVSPPPALPRPHKSQRLRDVGRLGSRSPTLKATSKSYPPPLPPHANPSGAQIASARDFPPPPKPPPLGASEEQLAAQTCGGWPSLGSVGHPDNCAGGCKYHWKAKGCKDGALCRYCHICSWRRYQKSREQRVDPMYLAFLESMAKEAPGVVEL